METKFMEENELINADILIPTKEELEQTIKHITETGEISFDDEIVLWKMKLIKFILKSEKTRI